MAMSDVLALILLVVVVAIGLSLIAYQVRTGVPVGVELAHALGAPLDVLVVRKLGAPGQPELAIGAIASGDVRVLNERVVSELGLEPDSIARIAAAEARATASERASELQLQVRAHRV